MKSLYSLLAACALVLTAAMQMSCSINDYCVGCEVGDAGNGSGSDDANDGGPDDSGIDASCVPSGSEECDGEDNDCNGLIDDGVLPQVGTACPNQMGNCAGGKLECKAGALQCDKAPAAEQCDGEDNNCNNMTDEGDPGGGGKCGTDEGECVAGINHCNTITGEIECIGFQDFRTTAEECDGKDNNCNGQFDEGLTNLGSCGPATDAGRCEFGTLICQGGAPFCKDAVFPALETCNNIDDDCDSDPNGAPGNGIDEIFDKAADPNNCVNCGVVCPTPSRTCINSTNNGDTCTSITDCQGTAPGKACAINSQRRCNNGCTYACGAGFIDLDGQANNGCEYRCSPTGNEECDGVDNDCDGTIDNAAQLTPPVGLCRDGGECGLVAPTPSCDGNNGWTCTYTGQVQFPETRCDDLDNDCDNNIDENQPNVDDACDDGEVGACRGTGTFQCNTANRDLPAVCVITDPGQVTPDANETCDDKDNDCDGKTDEGTQSGTLAGQEWVDIGGGVEIMKYEASRPDATDSQQGSKSSQFAATLVASPGGATQSGATATFTTIAAHGLTTGTKVRVSGVSVSGYNGIWTIATAPTTTTFTVTLATTGNAASGGGTVSRFYGACSKPEAVPWTNVTYPEALAVCESMGASLCSETTWHHACGAVTPNTTPVAISNGTTATSGTLIEAEDFFSNTYQGGAETACTGTTDNDGDGRANDGCPAFTGTGGPETACTGSTDDDNDDRPNDGCPTQEIGGETVCTGTSDNDDDNDGRANDGCPAYTQGEGPETICTGTFNNDDDNDGRANDGCPAFGTRAETGAECNNNSDDDNDGRDNDGCPATSRGAGPETGDQCNNNADDDFDGRDNDGCPAVIVGAGPETGADCFDTVDDDNDGWVNDGCPAFIGGAEEGDQCNNDDDDDGDTFVNDGCPAWGPHAWVEDYTAANSNLTQPQQHSGIANMRAMPNIGAALSQANALTQSPILTYRINIPTTAADWRIHVRMYSINTNEDAVYFNFNTSATPVTPTGTLTATTLGSWTWVQSTAQSLTAGDQYLRLFMAEDGAKVDAIFIARTTTPQPPCQNGASNSECASEISTDGGVWSYATDPDVYSATTCNGADRTAADDNILASGTLPACYADHDGAGTVKHVFDMSGNVKEWTLARVPGQNPIRGGASNDTAVGTSCNLNFSLGTDTFFFPNVGFRCCR